MSFWTAGFSYVLFIRLPQAQRGRSVLGNLEDSVTTTSAPQLEFAQRHLSPRRIIVWYSPIADSASQFRTARLSPGVIRPNALALKPHREVIERKG
jgi:hypothetical protein